MPGSSRGRTYVKVANASFGFSFILEANGGGTGLSPKVYNPYIGTGNFLKGFTDDNVAGVSLGWPSDPGDNVPPPVGAPLDRKYDAGVSPNNIRLSQASLSSITASYGIRATPEQSYLPTSFAFGRTLAGVIVPNAIIGDVTGIRKITVSLIFPNLALPLPVVNSDVAVLVNGGLLITPQNPRVELDFNNLGAVTVVNIAGLITGLTPRLTLGVHCEMNL